jgi:hypothetical protein
MEASSNPPAFLFDLDGTLVNSVYQHDAGVARSPGLGFSIFDNAVASVSNRSERSSGLNAPVTARSTHFVKGVWLLLHSQAGKSFFQPCRINRETTAVGHHLFDLVEGAEQA